MNKNPEKQKKRIHLGLLVILIITGVILSLAILFTAWFFFPVNDVAPASLLTPASAGYFSINFDSKSQGMNLLKVKAKESVLSFNISSFKKNLLQIAFSSFFPKKVSGIISLNSGSNKPGLTGIVSFGNEIKILAVLRGYIDKALFINGQTVQKKELGHPYRIRKQTEGEDKESGQQEKPVNAYTIIGKNLCISTDVTEITGSITSYKKGYSSSHTLTSMADIIIKDNKDQDGYLFLDNSRNSLSAMIKIIEDKFTFAAFPSINSVENIRGDFFLFPDKLTGIVRFTSRDINELEVIQGDVKFFYQALRRLVKPYNMELKAVIEIDSNSVVLDFNIKDFVDIIVNQFIKMKEK
ncbi:MAG: hypothetical protein JXJ04_11170 [Spirochaetales bacterium]|nr:hypothetical protein [Spirochaetales bacterium]